MKKTMALCFALSAFFGYQKMNAQTAAVKKIRYSAGMGPTDFPVLQFAKIKGAPVLQSPQLIMGATGPVKAEGMGFAAPAWLDVDDDGKKDLLIGEFGSRLEDKGLPSGNFVRIYRNEGTAEAPAFSDIYSYLYPNDAVSTTGTPLSINTWCCIGFTPRITDLDHDGHNDIITGQYNPGLVTWFRGSDSGFMPGKLLPQFADDRGAGKMADYMLPTEDEKSLGYWNYSAVDFGDFDGKGMQDMIVGGTALRISRNIGTAGEPKFGRREILLDINGQPLKMGPAFTRFKNGAGQPVPGASMVPTVADWDQDGIPDLLVTDSYLLPGSDAVVFFRAVRTPAGLRFEPGVPLFTTVSKQKAFPGSWTRVTVTDYNNDGVQDLLMGSSVATLSGKFDHALSWEWEEKTDIVKKHCAYYSADMKKIINYQMRASDSIKAVMKWTDAEMEKKQYSTRRSLFQHYYGKEAYKTLAHQGYVYVFLGKRED